MTSKSTEEEFPLVTIITPTYNSNPQYLKETIDSVLMQTYPRIEYIITDDGSKEFPEEMIVNMFSKETKGNICWKIIKNKKNIGTVKNMNGAIRAAHGEYIFCIAHDDIFSDRNIISEWVKEFQRTNAQIITGFVAVRNQDDRISNQDFMEYFSTLSPDLQYKYLCARNMIRAPAVAQSRKLFEDYGLYDETYRLMEDYPRWLYLTSRGVKIHFWNHLVVYYRSGGVSTSNQINQTLEKEKLNELHHIAEKQTGVKKVAHYLGYYTLNTCLKLIITSSESVPPTINEKMNKVYGHMSIMFSGIRSMFLPKRLLSFKNRYKK